jgi:hypothetical protein
MHLTESIINTQIESPVHSLNFEVHSIIEETAATRTKGLKAVE